MTAIDQRALDVEGGLGVQAAVPVDLGALSGETITFTVKVNVYSVDLASGDLTDLGSLIDALNGGGEAVFQFGADAGQRASVPIRGVDTQTLELTDPDIGPGASPERIDAALHAIDGAIATVSTNQAGLAMLAQANLLPQNLLALLR